MDVIEFYMGELEEALAEHDREVELHPAGSFGSEVTFLADRVVEAARAVLKAWDEENGPRCSECHEPIDQSDPHAGYGMCASCLHDALRSGWTPTTTEENA